MALSLSSITHGRGLLHVEYRETEAGYPLPRGKLVVLRLVNSLRRDVRMHVRQSGAQDLRKCTAVLFNSADHLAVRQRTAQRCQSETALWQSYSLRGLVAA
jgi:hypothetical protein